tara:strand:+ start:63 stop:185 length:123 start_codon:yes stop_codon:yes gene_type:complete
VEEVVGGGEGSMELPWKFHGTIMEHIKDNKYVVSNRRYAR